MGSAPAREPPPRGFAPWFDLFDRLRKLRAWGPLDRVPRAPSSGLPTGWKHARIPSASKSSSGATRAPNGGGNPQSVSSKRSARSEANSFIRRRSPISRTRPPSSTYRQQRSCGCDNAHSRRSPSAITSCSSAPNRPPSFRPPSTRSVPAGRSSPHQLRTHRRSRPCSTACPCLDIASWTGASRSTTRTISTRSVSSRSGATAPKWRH